jgi:dTDP-4-dehydrorhamnose reductase
VTLLVTGASGQLGSDLLRLRPDAVGLDRADLDVTDPAALDRAVGALPAGSWVLNCAAWTDVDAAEAAEAAATRVNGDAPGLLAAACARRQVALVHLSTDYVFAGSGAAPDPLELDDPTEPASAYGRGKLAGERAVRAAHPDGGYVVRTAWVYGRTGRNFVRTMARLERSKPTVQVVDDQVGSPTWSRDLAAALLELTERRPPAGVYHATNAGQTSWYGFAREVFRELGADPDRVRPTSSGALARPAPRPAWSVLSDRSWRDAGLTPLRPWRDALQAAFAEVGAELTAP